MILINNIFCVHYLIHSHPNNERNGRLLRTTNRYIPGKEFYIKRRIGEAAIGDTPAFRPMNNHPNQHYPQRQPNFGTSRMPPTEVSETDLYLLGAIEKLAYRVDYLEQRLRKTDQLVLHLISEANKDKQDKINKVEPIKKIDNNNGMYIIMINMYIK